MERLESYFITLSGTSAVQITQLKYKRAEKADGKWRFDAIFGPNLTSYDPYLIFLISHESTQNLLHCISVSWKSFGALPEIDGGLKK